jgi:DNA-binding transcriptional LysR family regulator
MLNLREIEYFVACMQNGSFSKAAEALFTTQSSVSKTIKTMEEEMGVSLFVRQAKGIHPTTEAEEMYIYAQAVLENMKKMESSRQKQRKALLSMSSNPSSWFADVFVDFYELHKKEDIHYQIYSADNREIAERVQERTDELGFVYVMKNQLAAFLYFLTRQYLEFVPLKETGIFLYTKQDSQELLDKDGTIDFSKLKLIQRFPDEFSPDNYWNIVDENGHTAAEAETVITTNSDYIMQRILNIGDLVNIAGGYLSGIPHNETAQKGTMVHSEEKIQFGYVKRRGEELSDLATAFLDFLKENLKI